MENINFRFPITVYNIKPSTDVLSMARVRIFYKGLNRNNTIITDEFAEKLLGTIQYAPVCGFYNEEESDFTDHGTSIEDSKPYGVVPQNPNITWEKFMDDDGIEREYACADVLLWTARYKAANEIVGKPQSMELYPKSIKGEWVNINGVRAFQFSQGSFLGLTPLGTEVEPCFEGAAFYTYQSTLSQMVKELEQYSLSNKNNQGGVKADMNFKLSDSEKYQKIWNLLNPNYTEASNWEVKKGIIDVYDNYILVRDYENAKYLSIPYTKSEETNEVILGEETEVFSIIVNTEEYEVLKQIRGESTTYAESFALITKATEDAATAEANYISTIADKNTEVENLNLKIAEFTGTISTLNTEKAEKDSEIATLNSFKAEIEKEQREAIFSKYNSLLDEETMNSFKEKNDLSNNELSKELAYALVEKSPTLFTLEENTLIPKHKEPVLSGSARLLKDYKDKNKTEEN